MQTPSYLIQVNEPNIKIFSSKSSFKTCLETRLRNAKIGFLSQGQKNFLRSFPVPSSGRFHRAGPPTPLSCPPASIRTCPDSPIPPTPAWAASPLALILPFPGICFPLPPASLLPITGAVCASLASASAVTHACTARARTLKAKAESYLEGWPGHNLGRPRQELPFPFPKHHFPVLDPQGAPCVGEPSFMAEGGGVGLRLVGVTARGSQEALSEPSDNPANPPGLRGGVQH